MDYTQINRPIKVSTPLGDDILMLRAMSGNEELGRLSQFDLDLLSRDDQINLDDVLGQSMTVELLLPDGETRYFNGIVSRFCQMGESGGFFVYQATLRPWLWLLTRTSDCRIFQEMTVPDIIKEVFRDNGFSDFEESLSGEYRTWEYCVQYRETDFNFVSRLMEQEGIYYYFIHEDGKHTLKLSDSISAHEPIASPDVSYYPPSQNVERDEDYIQEWFISHDLKPGAYVHRDFDFKNPKANLEAKLLNPFGHDKSNFEIYDYPGEFVTANEGNTYVRTRLEELHTQYERATGEGNVRTLYAGGLFNLQGYPRKDQNREYLVVSATHQLKSNSYEAGEGGGGDVYHCYFEVIDSQQQYRSSRITSKPIVQGPQTAIVVGSAGEKIWTDEYGRVKVQFHWDRYGEEDENSSCWVRVSQNRAGKGWGEMYIPHVGQEVIVSFLEGDPDRPIITGRVYNADNMPPLELPANKTMVAMRDHGGSEIVMQGEDGGQRITMFSPTGGARFSMGAGFNPAPGFHWETEDNWVAIIGTDQRWEVAGLRDTEICGTSDEAVDGAYSLTINNTRDVVVTGDDTETIGGDTTIRIAGKKDEKVGEKDYWNVGNEAKGVAGLTQETFVGMKTSESLAVTHEMFVGVKVATNLAADISIAAGFKYEKSKVKQLLEAPMVTHEADVSYTIKAPMIELDGNVQISFEVGGSKIVIGDSGIDIVAPKITLKASEINLDTPDLKGANVKVSLKNIKG